MAPALLDALSSPRVDRPSGPTTDSPSPSPNVAREARAATVFEPEMRYEVGVDVTTVLLAVDEGEVAEEVMHFLDRSGRARVVGTATDAKQLADAVRQLEPDAIVASPRLVPADAGGVTPVLAVDTRESVSSLRAAVRVGARGFYVWPADRGDLAAALDDVRHPGDAADAHATTLAVYGARGGVGTTFLASHLAAAAVAGDRDVVLVDMDAAFDDLTAALGVPPDEAVRTCADLRPLVDELAPGHLDAALWRHPSGFRALLAPRDGEDGTHVGPREYASILSTATATADVVILHVPRTIGPLARCAFDRADRVLIVMSLDVICFRATRRALEALGDIDVEACEFVVNRATRGEIVPADIRRAFGKSPIAVIPTDRGVATSQDHGRLLGSRSRASRSIRRTAEAVFAGTGR
jgi:pilus assembly protein CpaE